MVLHDKKSCFIHIPKCGGISVTRSWLAQQDKKVPFNIEIGRADFMQSLLEKE